MKSSLTVRARLPVRARLRAELGDGLPPCRPALAAGPRGSGLCCMLGAVCTRVARGDARVARLPARPAHQVAAALANPPPKPEAAHSPRRQRSSGPVQRSSGRAPRRALPALCAAARCPRRHDRARSCASLRASSSSSAAAASPALTAVPCRPIPPPDPESYAPYMPC